jgi:3-deoxy-D-manno-octulosonate 8-phosphate phosphatase (KDO 8-P phosphatase)
MIKGKQLAAKAKKIKLIAMDVDGVLTGGEMIVLDNGEEVKIWNVKDRLGFHLVHRSEAGIKFAWISGRGGSHVVRCAGEVGVEYLYQNCMKKIHAIEEIMAKAGVKQEEILYIGDDLIDIPVLKFAGLSVCPADSPKELKTAADYVSPLPGGKGVLREVVELVLKSRGLWEKATRHYIE